MEECAHPACTCRHDSDEMVNDGNSLYCSEVCAGQDPANAACDCEHPQCQG